MLNHDRAYGLHVICYDIANDRRRSCVVREIEAFGVRVQESVFECWIDEAQRRRLEQAISRLIRPQQDSFVCYRPGGAPGEIMIVGGELSAEQRFVLV